MFNPAKCSDRRARNVGGWDSVRVRGERAIFWMLAVLLVAVAVWVFLRFAAV